MEGKTRLQFLGATGYVTGSRILLETDNTRIYIDSGLYQGQKHIEEKNYAELDTSPHKIDAIVLTHAHIDHSGLLPLLVKKGFKGKIFCTPSSKELLEILLPDAGRLQEEEFKFLSKKKIKEYQLSEPLFNEQDAFETLQFIETIPFHTPFKFKDLVIEFFWAGHILGASYARITSNNKKYLFSGDIGPSNSIIHKTREEPPSADVVVIESTYGARYHETEDFYEKMLEAVKLATRRKGMLLIPSFAVGRTQLILYVLYRLIKNGKMPSLPIFIDSPMATRATRTYMQHPEEMKQEVIDEGFFEYISSEELMLIEDVISSKRLNYFNGPGVIISASGMCSGGRIMHHLFNRIWDRRNTILFVGYQAEGTLGKLLINGATRIKIFGRELPVRATIKSIQAFSAHADQNGLVNWIRKLSDSPPSHIFINHGEDESREVLKEKISFMKNSQIHLPKSEEIFYL